MSFVACPAAAAYAPAQASASRRTMRPMLQAERVLCARPRPLRAAAPRGCALDASGRGLWGPPAIREQSPLPPPMGGAWEIVHKETVAEGLPHAGRRSQALDPRVPAVRRQAHKLQRYLLVCREERAGKSPAHTRTFRESSERQHPIRAPHNNVPAARWRSAGPTALRKTWARSPSVRRVPRSRWSGEAGSARPGNAS